ncbi:putative nuclease HARBI1 [Heterodontus francisci]|uniref:putative nuclease HARBI1 n=1 Tax=Heterodontus francisci TaxID=7792 RepID=UPI00355AD0A8
MLPRRQQQAEQGGEDTQNDNIEEQPYRRQALARHCILGQGQIIFKCQRGLRMSREMVTEICRILQHELQLLDFGGNHMPVALKVTAALNFFYSCTFQRSMRDICGISQSATHRCIKEVTNVLFRHANDFIYLPVDQGRQAARSAAFGTIAGFLRVLGVIDHSWPLELCGPAVFVFVNRKDFHSLNVQLVCDHRRRMMHVCVHCPGTCHDSYILRNSQLPAVFKEPAEVDKWILGDKGYPLCTCLMTPMVHPQSPAEERYNAAYASTRVITEHTIGILKMKSLCLNQSGGALQYAPQRV